MDTRLIDEVLELLQRSDDHAKAAEKHIKQYENHSEAMRELMARAIYKIIYAENNPQGGTRRRKEISAQTLHHLKRFARPVSSLIIRRRPDGTGQITIDDDRPFDLPAKLTGLLVFAASGKRGPDEIVSFRTMAEAREVLSTNRISQLVYRLRQELDGHCWNPYLLETSHSCHSSSRLRFRTRKLLVIEDSQIVMGDSC